MNQVHNITSVSKSQIFDRIGVQEYTRMKIRLDEYLQHVFIEYSYIWSFSFLEVLVRF